MRKNIKIWLTIIGMLAVVTLLMIKISQPLEVETTTLQKGTLVRNFKETAKTKTKTQLTVTPPFSGKVLYVAEEGIQIAKGTVVLRLDPKDLSQKKQELLTGQAALTGQEKMTSPTLYQSQIKSAEIALEMATKTVSRLKEDRDKFEILYQEGAVSKSEYETVDRSYQDALQIRLLKENEKKLLLDQSQTKPGTAEYYANQKKVLGIQIQELERKISQQEVVAPIDCIVTKVNLLEGSFAQEGQSVLELSGSTDIIGVCNVLSSDASVLEVGQPVKLLQKMGEDTLERKGSILEIGHYATTKISALGLEEQRVEVKIHLEGDTDLIVGSDMEAIFETLRLEDILVLPKSAIFQEQSSFVWKVDKGTLIRQKVQTGKESDYEIQIIEGLQEGDHIVIDPNNSDLKEGKKVKMITDN